MELNRQELSAGMMRRKATMLSVSCSVSRGLLSFSIRILSPESMFADWRVVEPGKLRREGG